MSDSVEVRLAELERQQENTIRVGTVHAVNYAAAVAQVLIASVITTPRPWITQRAGGDRSWWAPEAGEQVVLLSPSGDFNQGIILPAIYTATAGAPASSPDVRRDAFSDGFVIEHDRAANHTVLNAWDSEGTIEIRAKNIILKTGDGGFYHLDHAGLATRITHLSGANYESDSWSTGSVVTGNADQGHSPPEVET